MSRNPCLGRRSRLTSRIAAGALALASLAFVPVAPARADGMPEPEVAPPAPKRHVVRQVHRRHHALVRRQSRPLIGYEIKHVHEDLGAVVYVQPAWPACRYVLDSYLVHTVRESYTGHFDCGS